MANVWPAENYVLPLVASVKLDRQRDFCSIKMLGREEIFDYEDESETL